MEKMNIFDLWLADRMKVWIDAIANSMTWTLSTVQGLDFPIYAGIPYGAQNVTAASGFSASPEPFILSVGFGAYQFKWTERMVRVDLYRHMATDVRSPSVEEWKEKTLTAFRHLLISESFNPPEQRLAELSVRGFRLAGYVMGKVE